MDEPPHLPVPPLNAHALMSNSPWSIGFVSVVSKKAVTWPLPSLMSPPKAIENLPVSPVCTSFGALA